MRRPVLVGSAPSIHRLAGIDAFAAAVNALQDPVLEGFAREFQLSTVHRPIPDEFLETAVAISLRLPARVWRGIMAGMLATASAPELDRLGIPTLALWGERDAVFPPAARRELLAQLPGARSRTYPATGHAPHWERPEIFAVDLVAFLPREVER